MIAKATKFAVLLVAIAQCQATRRTYKVRIDNLSFNQPLGGIFVSTHAGRTPPLFTFNEPASPELAKLAEDGNPQPLVDLFTAARGVREAFSVGGPIVPGSYKEFQMQIDYDSDLISLATMAVNTNDAFVALNGVKIDRRGGEFYLAGLDAGSEVNNELCSFIPGPACAGTSGNKRGVEGAEGFVHVHRGFFGINEGRDVAFNIDENDVSARGSPLTQARYDWRNPMAKVTITIMRAE
mmetsp:Transcript_3371/g.6654  ORF Transcript_3371/g.6654 Transcript_3371/m.6654 type:complete len:238 (-) Transcript_3371:234-947(-)